MRRHLVIMLLLLAAPLTAQVVVVNASVLDQGIDAKAVTQMFQGRSTTWTDGQSVVLVLADDPACDQELSEVVGRDRPLLLRVWKRLVFAGMGAMPLSAGSAEEALALVARTAGAMVLLDRAPADPRWRVITLMTTASQ